MSAGSEVVIRADKAVRAPCIGSGVESLRRQCQQRVVKRINCCCQSARRPSAARLAPMPSRNISERGRLIVCQSAAMTRTGGGMVPAALTSSDRHGKPAVEWSNSCGIQGKNKSIFLRWSSFRPSRRTSITFNCRPPARRNANGLSCCFWASSPRSSPPGALAISPVFPKLSIFCLYIG